MNAAARPARPARWPVARLLFANHLVFLALVWVAFAAIVTAVTLGIAAVGDVTRSIWEPAVSILRWFALGYGTSLTGTLLPAYVAQGQTRRDVMAQMTVYILVAGALFAALLTLGYALESVLYRMAGWPHVLTGERLFRAPDEFGLVFLTFCGVLLAWTVAGALLSAGFYRSGELGIAMIPLALALVGLAGAAVGYDNLPVVGNLFGIARIPLPLTVALCAGAVAMGLATTWALVRTLPLRNTTA